MSSAQGGLFANIAKYIFSRKKFFLIALIFLLLLAYTVFGKKGILQRVELEMENNELSKKLKQEQEKTLMLQKEINELKTSEKKLEQVAREKYGMVKEGEELYKVVIDSTK
jgi:cell division protein FtsB